MYVWENFTGAVVTAIRKCPFRKRGWYANVPSALPLTASEQDILEMQLRVQFSNRRNLEEMAKQYLQFNASILKLCYLASVRWATG
ncbi:MAG: hypothetical protein ACYTXT_39725 [Nostoc sp.]